MSIGEKFEKFTSHVESGITFGGGVGLAVALGILATHHFIPLSEVALVIGIPFGSVIIGLLAAAAAGKIFNDHLNNDLSEENRKKAQEDFTNNTLAGGLTGLGGWVVTMIALNFSPLRLSSPNARMGEILAALGGFVLVGVLIGAAVGLYKAGKITEEEQTPLAYGGSAAGTTNPFLEP
jgi:hypothetical protein